MKCHVVPLVYRCDYCCVVATGSHLDASFFLFSARRAAKEAQEAPIQPTPEKPKVDIRRFVKIGRPGYKG